MARSGGHKPKDHIIAEGFNRKKKGGLSERDLKKIERAAMLQKQRAERALERAKAKAEEKAEEIAAEKAIVQAEAGNGNEGKSAYEMLQDMRHVYKKVKGRDKLEKMINSDDRQFVFMVKELMKIEVALLTAKIRQKEDPQQQGNQTVFVVLKGLEDEKRFETESVKAGSVDLKQISQVLNPDGTEYGQ
jgi:hypothetical protein